MRRQIDDAGSICIIRNMNHQTSVDWPDEQCRAKRDRLFTRSEFTLQPPAQAH